MSGDNRHAPANTPGIRHIAFAVEDIDAVVAGLRARGAELVVPPLSEKARQAALADAYLESQL